MKYLKINIKLILTLTFLLSNCQNKKKKTKYNKNKIEYNKDTGSVIDSEDEENNISKKITKENSQSEGALVNNNLILNKDKQEDIIDIDSQSNVKDQETHQNDDNINNFQNNQINNFNKKNKTHNQKLREYISNNPQIPQSFLKKQVSIRSNSDSQAVHTIIKVKNNIEVKNDDEITSDIEILNDFDDETEIDITTIEIELEPWENEYLKKFKESVKFSIEDLRKISQEKINQARLNHRETIKSSSQKKKIFNKAKTIYSLAVETIKKIDVFQKKCFKLWNENISINIDISNVFCCLTFISTFMEIDFNYRICLKIMQSIALSKKDAETFINSLNKVTSLYNDFKDDIKHSSSAFKERFVKINTINIIKDISKRIKEVSGNFNFEGSSTKYLQFLLLYQEYIYRWSLKSERLKEWEKIVIKNNLFESKQVYNKHAYNEKLNLACNLLKNKTRKSEVSLKTGFSIDQILVIENNRLGRAKKALKEDPEKLEEILNLTGYNEEELIN